MDFIKKITPRTWIIIAITALLLILIIMYFSNKNKTITTTTTTTINQPQTSSTTAIKDDSFPLSYGSRGENVKKWQTYLNSKGATLTVDGIWGPLTEAASISKSGFNSITKNYFDSVVK